MRGTVKWYNDSKGFGFIDGEDGIEYFLHKSQIRGHEELREGNTVEFEAGKGHGGKQPTAQNVQKV